LGINTHFIMKFDFQSGLDFARSVVLQEWWLRRRQAAKEYCGFDKLLAAFSELKPCWLGCSANLTRPQGGLSQLSRCALMPHKKDSRTNTNDTFRQACELMEQLSTSTA